MRNRPVYVIVYSITICLAASLLLAVASSGLRETQERMREADRKFNVLKAFQAEVVTADGRRIPTETVETMYETHVREAWFNADGSPADGGLQVFLWTDDGVVSRYAIPVSGQGLWGPVYGYLALDLELKSILGVTFYRHQETPGLGGEIEKDAFVEPFRGQSILAADGSILPVEVVKGRVAERYPRGAPWIAVDGISGATLTGRGVSEFMTENLKTYEVVFQALRRGQP